MDLSIRWRAFLRAWKPTDHGQPTLPNSSFLDWEPPPSVAALAWDLALAAAWVLPVLAAIARLVPVAPQRAVGMLLPLQQQTHEPRRGGISRGMFLLVVGGDFGISHPVLGGVQPPPLLGHVRLLLRQGNHLPWACSEEKLPMALAAVAWLLI